MRRDDGRARLATRSRSRRRGLFAVEDGNGLFDQDGCDVAGSGDDGGGVGLSRADDDGFTAVERAFSTGRRSDGRRGRAGGRLGSREGLSDVELVLGVPLPSGRRRRPATDDAHTCTELGDESAGHGLGLGSRRGIGCGSSLLVRRLLLTREGRREEAVLLRVLDKLLGLLCDGQRKTCEREGCKP